MTKVDVLVIGGGQAGLGLGYYLKNANKNFLIADASLKVGDSWRQRWDSLELFTPRPFAGLPGLKVPKKYRYYPLRDEIADYFASYAQQFKLPVRSGCYVTKLEKQGKLFVASTPTEKIYAKQIVIASGPFHKPNIPDCATELASDVWQLHSVNYKNPHQVPSGPVLIVGGGNSGAQLAVELAKDHIVTIATSGQPWFLPASIAGISLYWYIFAVGILAADKDSWVARYVRRRGDGIVGRDLQKLIKCGVVRLIPAKLSRCQGHIVCFENGDQMNTNNVLWTTGFKPDFGWISIDNAISSTGLPIEDKGVSPIDGLYWLGLPWQTSLNSSIITGIKKDAKFIAGALDHHDSPKR